jgi:hypothetical protein
MSLYTQLQSEQSDEDVKDEYIAALRLIWGALACATEAVFDHN